MTNKPQTIDVSLIAGWHAARLALCTCLDERHYDVADRFISDMDDAAELLAKAVSAVTGEPLDALSVDIGPNCAVLLTGPARTFLIDADTFDLRQIASGNATDLREVSQ